MSRARWGALSFAVLAIAAAAVLTFAFPQRGPDPLPPRPASERPVLLLLTSLPIAFGEDFSLDQPRSATLEALETRYRVMPISVADPKELAKGKLLLMAQPLAQPAEDLVALDSWVRKGGRVMLLADPMLEWPSRRPLGDALRPPAAFMDTGLLAHWGLRLDAPDERGAELRKLGGYDVLTRSPGRLSGACPTGSDGLVAHCRIGEGRATIVADADWLNGGDPKGTRNLDALLVELALLEQK